MPDSSTGLVGFRVGRTPVGAMLPRGHGLPRLRPKVTRLTFPVFPTESRLISLTERDIRDSEARFTSNFLVLYPEELKNPEITRYTKK